MPPRRPQRRPGSAATRRVVAGHDVADHGAADAQHCGDQRADADDQTPAHVTTSRCRSVFAIVQARPDNAAAPIPPSSHLRPADDAP